MPDCQGYILRLPFRLAPGQEFANLVEPYDCDFLDLKFRIGERSGLYYFAVGVFPEEIVGKEFIPKLWAGLMWAVLHQGLSPEAELSPQSITYAEDPQTAAENMKRSLGLQLDRLDSILDGARPAVYSADKTVRVLTGQQVNLLQGFDPAKTVGLVKEALAMAHPEAILSDGKLRVALDLYNALFREASANARFLTLTMALEALSPYQPKHQCVTEMIDLWLAQLDRCQESVNPESEEWSEYVSLKREIGFRKERSIRSSIRTLVRTTLLKSDADAEILSRKAVKLYDKRSRLVHDGYLPPNELDQANTELRDIVLRVLRARFAQVAA